MRLLLEIIGGGAVLRRGFLLQNLTLGRRHGLVGGSREIGDELIVGGIFAVDMTGADDGGANPWQ